MSAWYAGPSHSSLCLYAGNRLTHLSRILEEWLREGIIEAKSLIQVQMHLRAIVSTCDSHHPRPKQKAVSTKSSTPAAPGKIPTLEKALVDSMNFLAKQDVDKKWFSKPVWELWPNDVHKVSLSSCQAAHRDRSLTCASV